MAINEELMKICDTIEAMVKDINDRVGELEKSAAGIKRYLGVSKCDKCNGKGWDWGVARVIDGEPEVDHTECLHCSATGMVKE